MKRYVSKTLLDKISVGFDSACRGSRAMAFEADLVAESQKPAPSDISNGAFCSKFAAAFKPSDEGLVVSMHPSALFAQVPSAGARGRLADVGVIWDMRLLPRPTQQCFGVQSLGYGFEQVPGRRGHTH